MTREDYESLLSSILDIGKIMLVAGAEIYRIEDTIRRLALAYDGERLQVVAVPSHIIVTATFDNREYSLSRRIDMTQTDLEKLDRVNNLCRMICVQKPEPSLLPEMIEKAGRGKDYSRFQTSLIYGFASSMFTLFYAGGWREAVISAIGGASLYQLKYFIQKSRGNQVFVNILCSAYAALLAILSEHFGLAGDADKIIIGVVMVLTPGVELLNSFRDFIAGDIQAGLMHLAEALFLAIMIAVGAAGMFALARYMGL